MKRALRLWADLYLRLKGHLLQVQELTPRPTSSCDTVPVVELQTRILNQHNKLKRE